MTIRTHKMIADAGETDTGKMTAQTSIAPATKLYVPCDEGSGTTVTDLSDTGLVLDNAGVSTTVLFTGVANSAKILHSGAATSGTVPQPASKSFLIWHHAIPVTLTGTYSFYLGDTGSGKNFIKILGAADWNLADNSSNGVVFPDANIPDVTLTKPFFGAMFINRDTNISSVYTSTDNASVTLAHSVDSSALVDDINFINNLEVGSLGEVDVYGFGMYIFDTTPTAADILTNLETIRQNQLTANKALPVDWLLEE